MQREHSIPILLWVATALLAHLAGYGGADRLVTLVERMVELRRFAVTVQRQVAGTSVPVEVSLLEEPSAADEPSPEQPVLPEQTPTLQPAAADLRVSEKPEIKPLPDPQAPKPPELALKLEKPKKDPAQKKPEESKALEQPPAEQRRIAVKQQVEDPNQADNPNAEFIGDQANRVKEQTQARITSTVEDDPKPNPGTAAAANDPEPGNARETRVAQDRDQPGAPRAPLPETGRPEPGRPREASVAPGAPPPGRATPPPLPAHPGEPAAPAVPASPGAPDTEAGGNDAWRIAQGKPASDAAPARKAKKRRLPPLPSKDPLLGFGSRALTASGINLNLLPRTAVEAIGRDKLAAERIQDAERRKSTHRGSWKSSGLERWRSAIENYVPSVKPGNQTALNTARVPFASYLNQIHNRIHPIFADTFLVSLDSMPASHPLNSKRDMFTSLEIVLDGQEGRLVRMGVTKGSGVTAFDVGALDSVSRATPFGPPPPVILSPDGNVYLHWEFHREPIYACSTYFARPYLLKTAPRSVPPKLEPPSTGERPQEHGLRAPLPAPAIMLAGVHTP